MTSTLRRALRALRAFGRFWWDFLIGDTPEMALAVAVIIGLAYLLHSLRLVAAFVLPLLTAVFLLASTYRGRRRDHPGTDTPGSPPPGGEAQSRPSGQPTQQP